LQLRLLDLGGSLMKVRVTYEHILVGLAAIDAGAVAWILHFLGGL